MTERGTQCSKSGCRDLPAQGWLPAPRSKPPGHRGGCKVKKTTPAAATPGEPEHRDPLCEYDQARAARIQEIAAFKDSTFAGLNDM